MKPSPFQFSIRLFRWFCKPDLLPSIEGDLLELFDERLKSKSLIVARFLFLWEVIKLLRPDIIKSWQPLFNFNRFGMIKNYFIIGWRNMIRQFEFSILNVAGLGIGIASALMVFLYVQNELNYDAHHEHIDRLYRVVHAYDEADPSAGDYQVWGGAPAGPVLEQKFPEVEAFCRFTSPKAMLLDYQGKQFQENNILCADSTVFDLFSWKLIEGDPSTALTNVDGIVLTESMAIKYFGETSALGKVIKMDHSESVIVTGVMEDIPSQSQIAFDALVPMIAFQKARPGIFNQWGYVDFYTYLKLSSVYAVDQLSAKTSSLYKNEIPEEMGDYHLGYEPKKGAYLYSEAARQPGPVGNITNLYMISCIGLFILVIACINFINLTTARSVERAKEVGVRKTLGANRSELSFQFLTESILITLIAFVFAIVCVVLFNPYLHLLVGKPIGYDVLLTWDSALMLFCMVLIIGILSGLYPSWAMSRFLPTKILRGQYKTSKSGSSLRRALVILQFSLAILLIIATTVVYHQLHYLKNMEKGFTSDHVLVVDFAWDFKVQSRIKTLKHRFLSHPDVVAVASSRAVPGDFFPNGGTTIDGPEGNPIYHGPAVYEVDADYINCFGMEMVAGRAFSKDLASDSSQALMINEAALSLYGYYQADDIIGKRFSQWGREGKVVGVVKNFNIKSLHHQVEPLALRYAQHRDLRKISFRVQSDDLHRTVTELEQIWIQHVPERPFNFTFLDETFNDLYQADEQFGNFFSVFASVAILVACLGLFGLTIYSTEQRTKEIGIRKVLGASPGSIVKLISKEFLILIFIAALVAIPASWMILDRWLEGFAYRMTMGPDVFLMAIAAAVILAMGTVSWQTIKAALRNPAEIIKNE